MSVVLRNTGFWLVNCQTYCTTVRQSCRWRVANRSRFGPTFPTWRARGTTGSAHCRSGRQPDVDRMARYAPRVARTGMGERTGTGGAGSYAAHGNRFLRFDVVPRFAWVVGSRHRRLVLV